MRVALISMLVLSSGAVGALALLALAPRLLRPGTAVREVASALSLAAILVITLRPTGDSSTVALRPFSEIWPALTDPGLHTTGQVVGNVLLFAPLGASLAARGLSVASTTMLGGTLSVLIELAQLVIPGRTTAVDDVLVNTLGAAVGALLWRRLRPGRRTG